MKPNIIIRADGGASIGMGHVVRCLALADMLNNDFTIAFAIQETAESVLKTIQKVIKKIILLPQTNNYTEDALNFSQYIASDDIVILDSYNFKTDYQKVVKEKNCKLICIDDLYAWHFLADAIINHADGIDKLSYSAEHSTKFYLGLNYVLLRKVFLEPNSALKKINCIKKVFISMGASDPDNLTQKFTEALLQIKGIEKIHLMLGSVNSNLKTLEHFIQKSKHANIITHFDISAGELSRLLQECDVAICPASTISLECCAIGVGLISGYTNESQLGILNGLKKNKAAVDLGNMNQLNVTEIKNIIDEFIRQPEVFNLLVENQKKMIDGKSPERLVDIFKGLSKEKLHFRFALESDVDLYFKWANDPLVRLNSYSQALVVYEDHVKWFQSKLISKNCNFYLFLNEQNIPVGQVRIEKNTTEAVIGISLDESFRGKSSGVEMLKMASTNFLQKNPGWMIAAYIKIENTSSYNIFFKAGFSNEEIVMEHGCKSYKLYKGPNV